MTELMIGALRDTLVMVFFSTLISCLIGIPIGIILIMTRKDGLSENLVLYRILDSVINILRSVPFVILMIVLFPISRIIVGTTIGTKGVIVPLSIAAAPFVARMAEQTLLEVDRGVIEAAKAMGSTNTEIIRKVLLPESMPSLVNMLAITTINIIGYTAMAGVIGGGGLGEIALRFGLYRYENDKLYVSVILIVLLVQLVQFAGTRISTGLNKK
ncbi:MAG: methionine ABC transporter permease [Tissierellia bacterium]|nr:methionine ABC transporter permease [Tissierellia bacterium]